MLKTIGRSKSITLLLAILLMAMHLHLPLHADANQLRFDSDAIKDLGSLAVKLQDPRAAVSQSITPKLSDETQQLLTGYDGISTPSPALQKALLTDLNQLLQTGGFYDAQLFTDIELSEETQALITQNPQNGDALMRLNRSLLADAYPHELASLSAEKRVEDLKGLETCRENLRQIKLALENYRAANADRDPKWLSELSPEYLDQKVLCCPADVTQGKPGVLTEGAEDPALPCSYLYAFRPSNKAIQEMLRIREGDMIAIVRCEHHLLNLSINGKLYRNGPQRIIYTNNKTELTQLADFLHDLRTQQGEAFSETQEGKEKIKQAIETLVLKQFVPKLLDGLAEKALAEVKPQLEAQLGKGILKTPQGQGILAQIMVQVNDQMLGHIEKKLRTQLELYLGEEFFKTQEGQDILEQLSVLISL